MTGPVWTLEALKEHIAALRTADQEAVKVLADNFEQRMATTNEWRESLSDLIKTRATAQQVDSLEERIERVELVIASTGGAKAGVTQSVALLFATVAAVGGVVGLIALLGGLQ